MREGRGNKDEKCRTGVGERERRDGDDNLDDYYWEGGDLRVS